MSDIIRQVVLDTETTGMNKGGAVYEGHRIIEIGCYELINRKPSGQRFHCYLNPGQAVDPEAIRVHGITDQFLVDKPRFADVAVEFMAFINGSELIIHNAPFDIAFLDQELRLCRFEPNNIAAVARVLDTLLLARSLHPGQKNNLDALCKRYFIDNGHRTLHGALLDAEILADVYLAMTGGQTTLNLQQEGGGNSDNNAITRLAADNPPLIVISASAAELEAHQKMLAKVDKKSGGALWNLQ